MSELRQMTNEELQEWMDYSNTLVDELLADGTNDEAYHVIEHHFSCQDFDILEKAAVIAFKMGYEVEEPEEAELETGEKVFAFDIVTDQLLDKDVIFDEVKVMFELASRTKIDYDGWGTYFEE